jgi:hypothetical protein
MLSGFHKGRNPASRLNNAIDVLNLLASGRGAYVRKDAVPHPPPKMFLARLTGPGEAAGEYEFAEVYMDADGEWQDVTDGRGTVEGDVAKDVNGACCCSGVVLMWTLRKEGTEVPAYRFLAGEMSLLCRIASSAAIAAANNGPESSATEWTYSVTPVSLDVASGDLSVTDLEAPTITTAFNGMEQGNRSISSGGTFGNGVKFDDLDDDDVTGSLQPVKAGTIVEVRLFVASDGNTYGLFSSPNGVTVECD